MFKSFVSAFNSESSTTSKTPSTLESAVAEVERLTKTVVSESERVVKTVVSESEIVAKAVVDAVKPDISPSLSPFSSQFVDDTSLPDNSVHPQGVTLAKIWAVKNNGSAAWPVGCKLVFTGGALIPSSSEVTVPAAKVGEIVYIEVDVQVPFAPGGTEVRGDFILVSIVL